jgi:hypothetical protein
MTETSNTHRDRPLGPPFFVGLAVMMIGEVGVLASTLYVMTMPFYWFAIINLFCLLTFSLATRFDRRLSQNAYPRLFMALFFFCLMPFTHLAFELVPKSAWDSWQLHPVGAAMAVCLLVTLLPEWFGILKTIASNNAVLDPPVTPHDESQASNPYAPPMLAKPQASDADLGFYGRPELPEIPDPG